MKKIVLFICIVLLTGCEAVYNVDIDKMMINDELVINALDSKTGEVTNKGMIDYNYENFYLAVDYDTPGYPEIYKKLDGYNYYAKEKLDNQKEYGLKFNYSFKPEEYGKTYLLIPFNYSEYSYEEGLITFKSGDPSGNALFLIYPDLKKLTVNITSSYDVVNSNADEVNNNTYTWILTKDNYKSKEIDLKVNTKEKYRKRFSAEFTDKVSTYFFMGLGIAVVVGLFIVLVKVKNSNK